MTAQSSPSLRELNMPPEARMLGEKLAEWCDEAAPDYAAGFAREGLPVSQRCRSCAFRKGTIPNATLSTMTALKCVMEHDPFHCHEKGNRNNVCVGWAIMVSKNVKEGREPIQCPWEVPES